ncbi:MAG: hypothetical protein ACO1RT_07680 [Planctomycetaceae bacterium]
MAVSANDFWKQLTRVGIVDPATCRGWIDRFQLLAAKRAAAAGAAAAKPVASDAIPVAQFLIANGVLTKFQSQRLLAGRGGELRFGDYLVLDRCDQPPLTRWFRARHLPSSVESFLYPCTDALTSPRWVDCQWLQAHAALVADGLQPITMLTLAAEDPWRGAVISELPPGRALDQWAADQGPLDHATVATIGQLLCNSLAAMHAAGLIHGEVRPSRIWCGEDQSLWLLRDAGRPPAHPADPPQEHRWFDDDSVAAVFGAPELAAPGAAPSPASDLFSVGALLYGLAAGRKWLPGDEPFTTPTEMLIARDAGAAGDPLLRTLAFAVDANPEGRFPDLQSFARALGAVVTAYETIPIPRARAAAPAEHAAPVAAASEPPASSPEPHPSVALPPVTPPAAATAQPRPEPPPAAQVPAAQTPTAQRSAGAPPVAKSQDEPAPPSPQPTRQPASKAPAATAASRVSTPDAPGEKPPAKGQPRPAAAIPASGPPVHPLPAPPVKPSPELMPAAPSPEASAPTANAGVAPAAVLAGASPAATSSAATSSATTSSATTSSATTSPATPSAAATAPRRPVRRRTRRTRRGPIIVGGVAAAILLGILAIVLRPADEGPRPRPRPLPPVREPVASTGTTSPRPSSTPAVATPSMPAATEAKTGYELVSDDRLLWASPWPPESVPPTLEMIPPGSQLVVTVRLNRVLGDGASSEWLDWLGPELGPALSGLEEQAAVKFAEVERLTIAMSVGTGGNPKMSFTITADQPLDVDAMTKLWKVTPARTAAGKTIYSGDSPQGNVYYVSENPARNRTFAFGPVDLISLVAENDGDAIPLARSLQQLWDTSSVDADLVALTIPNFLFADGRELLRRYAPRAVEPLRSVLIPDVAGAIVSMSFQDAWYVETRFTPSGTVSAPAMLQSLQPRIDALPAWAESFAIDTSVDASWRAMAIRLPQYMRAVADQTRYGVSQTLPTANLYLPREAAPQVILATTLALSSPESAPVVATTEAAPMQPLTAEQMLDKTLSVSFDQESLQFAVEMIRDEFVRSLPPGTPPPTIAIIGGDLEKMGITQNQQIRDFQMKDKPLREALTELARQANPDKSVTSLTDPKQSLVWVVDPSADPKMPTILITTRIAAEAKQIPLPKEFAQ